MSETHSREMEKTANVSLESGGMKFTALLDAVKATISLTIKVKETISTTHTTSESFEREVTYKGGQPLLFAEYQLVDRFTLERSNGVQVSPPWESKSGDELRQEAFPDAGLSNLTSQTKVPITTVILGQIFNPSVVD